MGPGAARRLPACACGAVPLPNFSASAHAQYGSTFAESIEAYRCTALVEARSVIISQPSANKLRHVLSLYGLKLANGELRSSNTTSMHIIIYKS